MDPLPTDLIKTSNKFINNLDLQTWIFLWPSKCRFHHLNWSVRSMLEICLSLSYGHIIYMVNCFTLNRMYRVSDLGMKKILLKMPLLMGHAMDDPNLIRTSMRASDTTSKILSNIWYVLQNLFLGSYASN